MATLYTIGHSTRTLEELITPLKVHQIETLVDIRAFPVSRRLPHFNREALEPAVRAEGLHYVWMKSLGGHRKRILDESPNIALRSESFRNYADYMLMPEFERAVVDLLALAERSRTAYMCAERVYLCCHRRMVSDWLVAHGHDVLHIDGVGPVGLHPLSEEARVVEGRLVYRGDRLL